MSRVKTHKRITARCHGQREIFIESYKRLKEETLLRELWKFVEKNTERRNTLSTLTNILLKGSVFIIPRSL